MLLFLVDDSDVAPFWSEIPEPTWIGWQKTGWEFRPVTPKDLTGNRNRPWAIRFREQIVTTANDSPFCVVTDARFGEVATGGIQLLNVLHDCSGFVRGCEYSIDLGTEPFRDQEKCLALEARGKTPEIVAADISTILPFLEFGVRPVFVQAVRIKYLTRAIHALHSIPVRLDADTVQAVSRNGTLTEEDQLLCAEIWSASFMPSSEGGETVLERRLRDILKPEEGEDVASFLLGIQEQENIAVSLIRQAASQCATDFPTGVDPANAAAWSEARSVALLKEWLPKVAGAFDQLIVYLRNVRKKCGQQN